eukprot:CAMPEP_0202726880 /NCGR_PEP_ID=MMETSP1385-20130828/184837_1 /ASSEMBLY_ACC=CAM_ASM_000861 /TAXON_ID=933848 /ORGANISM="Elphidium margaritaceum" /LENGTH=1136 /DNA_ID=CAMNT_0049393109 /DNA_START=73 /DNA_END=3481 /DNA_ORIENTATION=-
MQDLKLSSKWCVTLHDPKSHLPCCIFGQFDTLFGFWQVFNSMVEKNIFHALPLCVNITIYRDNVRQKPISLKQWHGEWNIELKHQANPIKIYQKIILLIVGEELTNKVTGMVLQREDANGEPGAFHAKISIFTNMDNVELDVKNILLCNNVIDLNLCVDKSVVFHPFRLLHVPVENLNKELEQLSTTPVAPPLTPDDKCAEMKTDAEPSHSHSHVPCVKYSMQSLLEYSALIQRPPSHAELALAQRFCDHDCIRKVFGKHLNAYHLKLLSTDTIAAEGLSEVLAAEGCAICLQTTPQSPYDAVVCGDVDEKESEIDDASKSLFIVAKCPDLHCQHVIHSQCMLNANDSILMRDKHCAFFFKTIDLSTLSKKAIRKEMGYHFDMQHTTGRKYHFSLRINHLISNQTSVSPQWTVPSYYQLCDDQRNKQECLQIFFENTQLPFCRGTIQVAVLADHALTTAQNVDQEVDVNDEEDGAGSNIFLHNANFEIPMQQPQQDSKLQCSHKIYQLQYTDPVSHNALIINVSIKWQPKLMLQLLSLRYELAIDTDCSAAAATPTCSTIQSVPSLHSLSMGTASPSPCASMTAIADSKHLQSLLPEASTSLSLGGTTSNHMVRTYDADSDSMSVLSGVTKYVDSILTNAATVTTTATNHNHNNQLQEPQLQLQEPMSPVSAIYFSSPPLIHTSLQQSPAAPTLAVPPAIQPLPFPVPRKKRMSPTTAAAAATASFKPESLIQYTLYNDPLELYHYACSPLGSAYISSKVANAAYFPIFFEKLSKFFPLLMVNALGHAVCRALYSQPHCAMSNKLSLLRSLIPEFADIASNRQGSFALICIMSLMTSAVEIEVLTDAFLSCIEYRLQSTRLVCVDLHHEFDDEAVEIEVLTDAFLSCIDGDSDEDQDEDDEEENDDNAKFDVILLSQSGYHVIKKYIAFGYPHFNCILHAIGNDFTKYATHHYGVPIIRSTLDMIASNPELVAEYQQYLQLFAQHTHSLVSNQYGNYVMQQLLEISPPIITDTIKEFMSAKYAEYAQHKFASNVVEKCLKHTLAAFKEQLEEDVQQQKQQQHASESCSPHRLNVDTEEKDEEHVADGSSSSSSTSSCSKPGGKRSRRKRRKRSGNKKENEMSKQQTMVCAENDNHW